MEYKDKKVITQLTFHAALARHSQYIKHYYRRRKLEEKLEPKPVPNWLTKIQNNSWEPEIIISGFSIAFFFILPKYIYNFTAMLIQDFGADELLSYIIYSLMIFIISSLKVLFIGHLILRGLWTGLVGLSYVFPNGIRNERLEKELQGFTFKKPIDLVIDIEKICSLFFSFAFMIILNLIKVMLFYFVLITGYIVFYKFNLNSAGMQVAQLSLIFLILGFMIFKAHRNKKWLEKTSNSISYNLIYTFSTNISKKRLFLVLLSFILITIPISYSSIASFKFAVEKERKTPKSELTMIDQNDYLDKSNSNLRVQRAAVSSFQPENNLLELYISSYKEDETLIRDIQDNFKKFEQVNPDVALDKLSRTGLYQIFIDDELIEVKDWIMQKGVENSQNFLTTDIDINNISSGIHNLKIKRVKWRKKQKDFILIENWATIPFKI